MLGDIASVPKYRNLQELWAAKQTLQARWSITRLAVSPPSYVSSFFPCLTLARSIHGSVFSVVHHTSRSQQMARWSRAWKLLHALLPEDTITHCSDPSGRSWSRTNSVVAASERSRRVSHLTHIDGVRDFTNAELWETGPKVPTASRVVVSRRKVAFIGCESEGGSSGHERSRAGGCLGQNMDVESGSVWGRAGPMLCWCGKIVTSHTRVCRGAAVRGDSKNSFACKLLERSHVWNATQIEIVIEIRVVLCVRWSSR